MVSPGDCSHDELISDKAENRESSGSGNDVPQKILNNGVNASKSDQEQSLPTLMPEKAAQGSDQERCVSPLGPENVTKTPDVSGHPLQSSLEGNVPYIIREKVSEDGYNWRKYGQKLVKGNEFVRSYYKCTYPNCQVKKQLERSQNGQITDTVHFGQHDHPKPQINIPVAVGLVVSVAEGRPEAPSSTSAQDNPSDRHGHAPLQTKRVDTPLLSKGVPSNNELDSDDAQGSKRTKKEHSNVEASPVDKPSVVPRFVVKTPSEVDIVNDGYRWRKYGQKLVKGNPNPRSYYRCSSPGCPAKKHVERAFQDLKLVITTYEGLHDHAMPPARSVIQNTSGTNIYSTTHYGEKALHTGSDPEAKLNAKQNGKSEVSEASSSCGPNTDAYPKQNERLDVESSAAKAGVHEGNCHGIVVHENNGTKKNLQEQQTPNAEPIQS